MWGLGAWLAKFRVQGFGFLVGLVMVGLLPPRGAKMESTSRNAGALILRVGFRGRVPVQ